MIVSSFSIQSLLKEVSSEVLNPTGVQHSSCVGRKIISSSTQDSG
jgi:hypothetical protein